MRRISLTLLVSALAIALAACARSDSKPVVASAATTRLAGPTPLEILQTEIEAFNRSDVEGSVSWFTLDAVLVTALGGCAPCIGQGAIRDHWSRAVSAQTKIGVDTARTEGDVVRASSWLRAPSLPDGVERAVGTVTVTVRDGRIARWDQEYDLNDPQTARLFAAVALTTSSRHRSRE